MKELFKDELFLHIPKLGTLNYYKIYHIYDLPVIFLATLEETGDKYLCYSLQNNVTTDALEEIWLIFKTSEEEILDLELNKVSLTAFFKSSVENNNGYIVEFVSYYSSMKNDEVIFKKATKEIFDEFLMPKCNVFLFKIDD